MTSKIEHRIMTSKEKAKELYNKMLQWQDNADIYIERKITSTNAKQSALIAVDEVIDNIEDDYMHYELDWWQEVKQEINKL